MNEIFKIHPQLGCKVSNTGKVISYLGKELIGTTDRYRRVLISINNKRYYKFVHRLVYETFVGPIPDNMTINHIDGNRLNNNLNNLELLTHRENIEHSIKNHNYKRFRIGEANGNSILKEADILNMYQLIKEGYNNKSISEIYNINFRTVSQIRKGQRWNHLFKKHLNKIYPSNKSFYRNSSATTIPGMGVQHKLMVLEKQETL